MYFKQKFISIKQNFGDIVKGLSTKRLEYPKTIVYCQRCEDCADIFLFFQENMAVNFTDLRMLLMLLLKFHVLEWWICL